MEKFDKYKKWFKERYNFIPDETHASWDAWNHQQKIIDDLKATVELYKSGDKHQNLGDNKQLKKGAIWAQIVKNAMLTCTRMKMGFIALFVDMNRKYRS